MTHEDLSKYINNFLYTQSPIIKGFPLCNVYTLGEDKARIEIALAGYSREEIKVVQRPIVDSTFTRLEISSEKYREDDEVSEDICYSRRELCFKPFKKEFVLVPYIEVENISMRDGLLTIKLIRKLPKNLEPKTFTIE